MKKNILITLLILVGLVWMLGVTARAAEPEFIDTSLPYGPVAERVSGPNEDAEPFLVSIFREVDWGGGEYTALAYRNPYVWEDTYAVRDTDKYVVRVNDYLMLLTPAAYFGPVWRYTNYHTTGELYGVTSSGFVFREGEKLVAVYWGDFDGKRYNYLDFPERERRTFHEVSEAHIHPSRYVQLESWNGSCYEYWIDDDQRTVHVDFPGWTVSQVDATVYLAEDANTDREYLYDGGLVVWHQFSGGCNQTFFDQAVEEGGREAVFIGAVNGAAMILEVPFEEQFIRADACGITFLTEEGFFFESYFPWYDENGNIFFGRKIPQFIYQNVSEEFPMELNGNSQSSTISMDMTPRF